MLKTSIAAALLLLVPMNAANSGQSTQLGKPNTKSNGIVLTGPGRGDRTCGFNMQLCRAGSQGAGGCYNMGYAQCYEGRVCSQGLTICRKGSKGAGGCYRLGAATCDQGRVRLN